MRLIPRSVLPNVLAPITVVASVTTAAVIIAESSPSLLGLGAPSLIVSGGMLSVEAHEKMEIAPHMAVSPGPAVLLAALACNLPGDALRDVPDPRPRV